MAEIIDLYTVDREHTGKTAKRGEPLDEGTYRMVVHVCIFNSKSEMLIQKRADNIVRWPSYWDVSVGGGASAGDTSRQAAERETEEVADAKWASRKEIEAMIDDGSFIPYQKDLLGYLFFAREGRGTWNL